jgi:hypothetical protein
VHGDPHQKTRNTNQVWSQQSAGLGGGGRVEYARRVTLAWALSLALLGSGVGVHLEEIGELPLEEGSELARELGRAVERRTGEHFVLDDPLWPPCQSADRCLAAIRDRTRANDLVLVKVYGAPTKIRLIAERLELGAISGQRVELNVPRAREQWTPTLDEAALALFPKAPIAKREDDAARAATAPPPQEEERWPLWVPYAVLGTGALALAAGAAFGLSSSSARDRAETVELSDEEYARTIDRMRAHGLAANILFGTAAAGLGAGLALLIAR